MDDVTLVGKDKNLSGFVEAFTGVKFDNDELVGDMELPVFIGMKSDGKPDVVDLADRTSVLLAGELGSGKTFKALSLLGCLAFTNREDDFTVEILKTKNLYYSAFETSPYFTVTSSSYANKEHDISAILKRIDHIKSELDRRRELLIAEGKENWRQLRRDSELKYPCNYPWLVVVLEDFSRLMELVKGLDDSGEIANKFIQDVESIVSDSRALGVITIIAVHGTDRVHLSKELLANSSLRLGFYSSEAHLTRLCGGSKDVSDLLPRRTIDTLVFDSKDRNKEPYLVGNPVFAVDLLSLSKLILEFVHL